MKTIEVQGISKRYLIGGRRADSLRDSLAAVFSRSARNGHRDEHWALRDVSFDVEDGETLGIIGHNGAGKSTLLKILSRVTKPTAGHAKLRGRVGSLLEVGTGFHNELTGRENVFMNGAILGMRRSEIASKFDEIVAFSEIERFLDTPVKHYSSGMYMRLAFSVAAHLDPEILIVDEVLAVGDVSFQRKCLRKMRDVGESGRTVIFVSHDMASITRLCKRTIALNDGSIASDGASVEVVRDYVSNSWGTRAERDFTDERDVPQSEFVRLLRTRVIDTGGNTNGSFDIRHPVGIEMTYEVTAAGQILIPNIQVFDQARVHLFTIHDLDREVSKVPREKGVFVSTAWIPGNLLAEGSFILNAAVVTYVPDQIIHLYVREAVSFSVFDPMTGDTARGDFAGRMDGVVRPIVTWDTKKIGGIN